MQQELERALRNLDNACDDLRVALNKANGAEGIVILQLIEQDNHTIRLVSQLINAKAYDKGAK